MNYCEKPGTQPGLFDIVSVGTSVNTNCGEIFTDVNSLPTPTEVQDGYRCHGWELNFLDQYTQCRWVDEPNTGDPSTGGNGQVNSNDYNLDISCTSFVFTKTSSLWQEAGVKGFRINIVYWTEQRRESRQYDIPGQVVIGMPLKRSNGQAISSGQAATIAAHIVDKAADATFIEYRDAQTLPSDWAVQQSFRNNLNSAAASMGIGANASTNGSGSPLILIKQSEFSFFGTGNCDN